MAELLQFVFSGLTVGAVYALVALGFTLIYNASDIINFAQGEFVMLGGMTTVFLSVAGVPLPVAALIAIALTTAVGLALHRLAIEPARGSSPVALIMITIGASIFLRGVAQIVFDKRFHSLPPLFGNEPLHFGGATILPQSLVVLAGAAVIVVLLWLFIERTLLGKAVVATAANRLAARLIGINTRRIVDFSFAVSAAIGAVAGILVTPITLTSYDVGTLLALKGFAAAMLGGIGSARRRGGRRPAARHDRGVHRRLYLLELQGRRRLPDHPHRARRHAAGLVRPRQDRAGVRWSGSSTGATWPLAALAAIVVIAPLFFSSLYYYRIGALVFIFALAVVGLNLLMGFAGQVSLGHAGFLGIGAYAVAIGPTYFGVPSWLCLIVGAVLSGAVAFAGRPPDPQAQGPLSRGRHARLRRAGGHRADQRGGLDRRARRHERAAPHAVRLDGARLRRLVLDRRRDLHRRLHAGHSIWSTARAAARCRRSTTARSPPRMLGVDVARKKLMIFIISAVYASVAGSYLALFDGHITPDVAGFLRSIELVAMVVLGGMGSVFGALVGAAVLVVLPQAAHRVPRIRAGAARADHHGVHDLPAPRHRAVACRRAHGRVAPMTIL